jgi:hypothetical protein
MSSKRKISQTKRKACRRSSVGRGGSSMHDEQNMKEQEKEKLWGQAGYAAVG